MTSPPDIPALDNALERTVGRLLAARSDRASWTGELATSALATATAATALALVDRDAHASTVAAALDWLVRNANDDGGWGDTTVSTSNLSTTLLVWSAFGAAGTDDAHRSAAANAEVWIGARVGSTEPDRVASALVERYGSDRTFSVPILTMCALSGRLGPPDRAWRLVPALPFELGILSHRWLRRLRLPVVSYALPALIAIGQVRYHHRRPINPLVRILRGATRAATLRRLERIQPAGGGFLEAAPLTSFVVMSLAGMGLGRHPAAARGVEFLLRTVRPNGGWAIDTNLATWVTTLSVKALAAAGPLGRHLPDHQRDATVDWLLAQQYRDRHPYTDAAPGGWAWTDLPGGVPDADDTAGAMLALRALAPSDPAARDAAAAGAEWLLGLQNRDGGMPTFCRGWGTLEFDRSGADLTAHAAAALAAWGADMPDALAVRAAAAVDRMIGYLTGAQRADGSWEALWFGNEHADDEANLTYGTARVISALADIGPDQPRVRTLLDRAAAWLATAQNADGGWGGQPGTPSSLEETAQALGALAKVLTAGSTGFQPVHQPVQLQGPSLKDCATDCIARAAAWLVERTDGGTRFDPAPIGLYFARLWYFERLYPLIFTVSALGRARDALTGL